MALSTVLLATTGHAAMPAYLREAMGKFRTEVPPDWAYTQKTVRNAESTVERFDPTRPPAEQWTLVLHNGHPPTAEEREKYVGFRADSASPRTQASFQKSDIDTDSFALVREDADRADFSFAFRAEATGADKMLRHLRLTLTVHKQPAWVEKFVLELLSPYWPVLGVKMNALTVRMNFRPPGSACPSLPALSSSWFSGRILLVPTQEDLRVTYAEFARSNPAQ